jgi:hypothetical protein
MVGKDAALHPLLVRWSLVLLLIGILGRTLAYLPAMPVSAEEASLCLDLVGLKDAKGGRSSSNPAAPVLFPWLERGAIRLLGMTGWAARLVPFLAGLGGFLLFWPLVRRLLSPDAAVLALGFFAVWPTERGVPIGPFVLVLPAALLLLLAVGEWLANPTALLPRIALTLALPLALLAFPVALSFAICLAVAFLPVVWMWRKKGNAKAILWIGTLLLGTSAVLLPQNLLLMTALAGGAGLSWMIQGRKRILYLACGALVAIALGAAFAQMRGSPTSQGDRWPRTMARALAKPWKRGDLVVFLRGETALDPVLSWQLAGLAQARHVRLDWDGTPCHGLLEHGNNQVHAIKFPNSPRSFEETAAGLASTGRAWHVTRRQRFSFVPREKTRGQTLHCEFRTWKVL